METYEQTLHSAIAVGASKANDGQLMALFCAGPLQTLCGAVAPSLVFEGAQKKGLNSKELAALAAKKPAAVADLMWV